MDDAIAASAYNNAFEFKDAVKQAGEYAYDANGNLTKDLNKGITTIQYNVLNLPSAVNFNDGSTITYTYAADGTKLQTVHKIGGTTTTTDYCTNVIYENGTAKLLITEEGYVSLSDLGLTLLDMNGTIKIGNKNGRVDIYDFDFHKGGSTFRNIATKIGNGVAGKGTPYEIYGYGFGKVNHRVNRPFSSRRWIL